MSFADLNFKDYILMFIQDLFHIEMLLEQLF